MNDAESEHPIPDSYWAHPHRLLAGPLPTAPDRPQLRARVQALLDAGIRTVIDLRTAAESPAIRSLVLKLGTPEQSPCFFSVPILNGSAPNAHGMSLILDLIDASLRRSRPVYVHCQGGLGRTGTVVACWWIRHGHYDLDGALEALRTRREGQPHGHKPSPETGIQHRLLKSWMPGM